jgi:hypothetical protein
MRDYEEKAIEKCANYLTSILSMFNELRSQFTINGPQQRKLELLHAILANVEDFETKVGFDLFGLPTRTPIRSDDMYKTIIGFEGAIVHENTPRGTVDFVPKSVSAEGQKLHNHSFTYFFDGDGCQDGYATIHDVKCHAEMHGKKSYQGMQVYRVKPNGEVDTTWSRTVDFYGKRAILKK